MADRASKNNLCRLPEVHKDPAEILVILFNAVIQRFNVLLFQEPQDMLFKLPAALAWNDLN